MKYQDIKTFEDACKVLNIGTELPQVSTLPEKHQKAIVAFYMLTTVIEAVNEGWAPDWSDTDQSKYFAYFGIEADKDTPGGSGFSGSDCSYNFNCSFVGSRLCLKDRDRVNYVRKQFEKLYKDYFLI